jgi:hypothetical protein
VAGRPEATSYPVRRRIFTNPTMNRVTKRADFRTMERLLTYDMMLEVEGVLRSEDVRVNLYRELHPGEMINVRGRDWLVTDVTVAKPNHGLDRRVIAREVAKEGA